MQRKLRRDYWFFVEKRRLITEFVIQGEPQREMASAIISREEPVGRRSHTNMRIHFFIKTQRRGGARQRYKKKIIGSSELMDQGADVQFVSYTPTQNRPKTDKQALWKARSYSGGNSWFLPVFHKGAVIYSHVGWQSDGDKQSRCSIRAATGVWCRQRAHKVSHCVLTSCDVQSKE